MTDLALRYDPALGAFDLVLDPVTGDLVTDDGLETAVTLSLFTDRRAQEGDALPGGAPAQYNGDRRGWWGDALTADAPLGSRLWLLSREKTLAETAARARTYAQEGLAWLRRAGIAERVDVVATAVPAESRIELDVVVTRPEGGARVEYRWRNLWEPQDAV
ncbi:conserved hypothetical protein [Candidatus Defluviicoccus seviourii]|uniref:Mu-like prophage protein gp46 n=1 Tax=Candidatus Defluviicoccus seviourii TaxID=2565273 RepID=A0A564WH84_9PROT|nr:conserved hypothetical protein [Candidatus Defluviicoccus seviourii]